MARRGDLAGLAALGALGYMLTRDDKKKAPVEDRIGTPVTRDIPAADTRDFGVDYTESPNRGGDFMSDKEPGWESSVAPARTTSVRQTPTTGRQATANIRPMSRGADTPGSIRAYENALAEKRYQDRMRPEAQAVENVYPEANLIAPGLKTLSAAAKNLAGRAAPLREYIQPTIGYAERKLLQGPAKQLTGPSKAELLARDRAARAAAREEERTRFNRLTTELGEADLPYKKGGKVKAKAKKMASGGMAKSSASKRADGIATKGKTKCKMY